jgi:rod shape-determining protein MreD
MLRGLICSAAVVLAVIVQLTIINRIAFPGGTGPDLVLLAVAALSLANGPLAGSLIGFCAGLALDVAPPGSHFVGQDALVFCLIGYACGLVADEPSSDGVPDQGHTALFEITVTAVAVVFGEALSSLLGAMLSDPRVTWAAITHVLPIAVIYDLLLCPFVLLAVAAALRLAGGARRSRTSGQQPRRAVASSSGLAHATPRLRLSEHGHGAMSGAGSLGAAFSSSGAAKVKFGAGRGGRPLGGSMLGGAAALNSGLGGSRLNSSRFGPSRMGRSLLGGSVFSRSPSALRSPSSARKPALMGHSSFLGRSSLLGRSPLGRSPALGRSAGLGRSAASRRARGQLRSAAGGSAAGYAPRLARPGPLARLAGALRRPARRQPRLHQRQAAFRPPIAGRSPGRGWLRGSSLRRGRMGRGLTPGRMPGRGSAPARLHMRRSRFKRRWRTGGYR